MNKKQLTFLLKIILTAVVLYYVFRKVDLKKIVSVLSDVHVGLFAVSFACYVFSKAIASYRLWHLYASIGVVLDKIYNLKLYWVGMFYNLFLPGGIGGDGYKVYLLKQAYPDIKTKQFVGATFLDRLSGLAALVCLALLSFSTSTFTTYFRIPAFCPWMAAVVVFPAFFVFIHLLFKSFKKVFFTTSILSVAVQSVQAFSAYILLLAMGIADQLWNYITLFLVSSVALVVPFFHGGIGAREFVFSEGAKILEVQTEQALAYSFAFFIINLFASAIGVAFMRQIKMPTE
ncbi:MAG: lysylphosphatidylglycerol synthase transmembrane domain-containing protein [Cyclobacteriaceae bacterium]